MINLYSINNTEYSKNGDATLQPLRCELTMAINGGWQLELELPYDKDEKWKLVDIGTVVRVTLGCIREQATVQQRFRVYDYRKTLTSLVAIAFPVAMESTQDAPIDNLAITNKTGVEAMALLQAKTNKYTLYTDITKRGTTSISNSNLNYVIASGESGCFIDVWGGEIVYDNLTFKVFSQIGDKNNASKYPVIYGRNMTGIEYERDDSGMVTRIYPISSDGIRLNGSGYVDSPIIHNYPIVHARFMSAPYQLVIDKETDNSATATATRTALAAIKTASMSLSHDITISLISGAVRVPFDYIKKNKSGDENQAGIIDSVQAMATAEIYHETLKSKANKAIKDGMMDENNGAFVVADKYLEKNWEWHEDTSVTPHAWWYGYEGDGDSVYARNEYIKIGKYYEYFNDDGYWEEYKRIPSIDLYHNDDGSWSIGYKEGYYAHNEYVYMTVEGQMEEWWYDSEGWYVADSSGASDFGWHGDSSSGIWFGEEDAGSEDKSKYLHDCWAFIDGTYYFFDQYGFTDADPVHSLPDYPWGRQVDEKTGKEWFGNTNKSIGAKWLYNQWIKLDGDYYYVDSEGYVRDENDSVDAVVNAYVTGLANLKTVCNTQRDTLYTLLYQQMTAWCNRQYEAGIDKPVVTIRVDMADLSKTDEYKNYTQLERICLGDVVECIDSEHGINTQERVIGLTYDCIRGYNKNIVIGHTEASLGSILSTNTGGGSVPSGFDTSAIETALTTQGNAIATLQNGKQDKLTAGDNITIVNNVISATGGAGLQYWHETANRFYREGTHEGISGLANYLKPSNNEIGYWQRGQGWSRCIVVRLKGNPRNVIMGYTLQTGNKHPILCFASNSVLDFEWGWSNNTLNPPYGVTEWQDKSTYPVPTEGYDWYFGWGTATAIYEGTTWNILAVDCLYWDGGDEIDSTDGLSGFSLGKWNNKPDISLVGYDLLETANAVPYTEVVVEIGTDTYAFKYGGDDKTYTYVDTDGNALFKEITTDAGSLTQQMAQKQNLLTAGSNIQINEGTISATDTTYEEFDGDSAGLVPAVQTQSGKFLKDDGTWDDAGGGTDVEANPSGSATNTLTKLRIDDTIYGISGGGGGSFVDMSIGEYNQLPSADKLDATKLYLLSGTGTDYALIDESAGNVQKEGSMNFVLTSSSTTAVWNGGSSIGGQVTFAAIDITNIHEIKYELTTGTCYAHNNSNVEEQTTVNFQLIVGILSSVPSSWMNPSSFITKNIHKYTNTTYTQAECTLDVSNYTGVVYIGFMAHGWNATFQNLGYDVEIKTNPIIKYKDVKYAQISNAILYGTSAPIVSGDEIDGDLYILLDSNNSKQGEYLYMNNSWVQIE